jgi:hypothetical protein
LDINRFLPGSKFIEAGLNLVQSGHHVGREVDGLLAGEFDHEAGSFVEEAGDA